VVAWGTDGAGDTDVPAGLANVVAITAGWYTSLALKSDGTVVVWGLGNYGQTNVPPGLTNLVGIAAGRWHCLALGTPPVITTQPQSQTVTAGNGATFNVAATGTSPLYYQWRKNGSILTDGDNIWGANSSTLTLTRLTPWDAGIYTVVVSNAAGSVTSLYAVLRVWTPSGVVAWGYNGYGETNVPSGLTNVVAIAAGGMDWSLALKNDGKAWISYDARTWTALAGAGLGYLTFLASDEQLRSIQFWLLGSLGGLNERLDPRCGGIVLSRRHFSPDAYGVLDRGALLRRDRDRVAVAVAVHVPAGRGVSHDSGPPSR